MTSIVRLAARIAAAPIIAVPAHLVPMMEIADGARSIRRHPLVVPRRAPPESGVVGVSVPAREIVNGAASAAIQTVATPRHSAARQTVPVRVIVPAVQIVHGVPTIPLPTTVAEMPSHVVLQTARAAIVPAGGFARGVHPAAAMTVKGSRGTAATAGAYVPVVGPASSAVLHSRA